jgi:hypothetical protein
MGEFFIIYALEQSVTLRLDTTGADGQSYIQDQKSFRSTEQSSRLCEPKQKWL